jgi:hypothetical protein
MKICEFCTDPEFCRLQNECDGDDPSTILDEEFWNASNLDEDLE